MILDQYSNLQIQPGMYSAEETVYTKSHIAARDIPAEYLQYYNLGREEGTITVNPDNWDYQKSGLMSWMGRAMYTYVTYIAAYT